MFDISFGELLLILIVGLLVFGPEKLPQVVRTGSLWLARIRRSFNQVRADIEREMGVDDIKRDLHNHSIMDTLRDVKKDLQDTKQQLDDLPYQLDQTVRDNIHSEVAHHESIRPKIEPEPVIPDNDFQHNETQHHDASHSEETAGEIKTATASTSSSPSRSSPN